MTKLGKGMARAAALAVAGALSGCFFMDLDTRSLPPQRPEATLHEGSFEPGEEVTFYAGAIALGEPVSVKVTASRGTVTATSSDRGGTTFRWRDGGPDAGTAGVVVFTSKATGPKGTQSVTKYLEIDRDGWKWLKEELPEVRHYLDGGPIGFTFDREGNFLVLAKGSGRLVRISAKGKVVGSTVLEKNPQAMAVDGEGYTWVMNLEKDRALTRVSPTGEVLGHYPLPMPGTAVAADAGGNAWVATGSGVHRMAPDGKDLGVVYPGYTLGVAIDAAGTAWLLEHDALVAKAPDRVVRVATTGDFAKLGAADAGAGATAIAFDRAGNAWIANKAGGDVTKLGPDGTRLGTFAVGTEPRALACDAEGNAWVCLAGENVVKKLSADGKVLARYNADNLPTAIGFDQEGAPWSLSAMDGTLTKADRVLKEVAAAADVR